MAANIHDIGKISVPAEMLAKPTSLSDVEMEFIRMHPGRVMTY
jgi:HD-GYP domain-containing protein (c-di-GMP phosphodiesterase class II)